jgi:hypothetical protein
MNSLKKKSNSPQQSGRTVQRQQRKAAASRQLDVAISESNFWGKRRSARFPGIGFPDELKCTLKYVEEGISFSGLAPSAQVFRINSLFDPNLTGVGHQPLWFDQLAFVYGKYLVTAARVEAEIINLNGTNGIATCVASYDDVDNSALAVQDLAESRYSHTEMCGLSNGGSAIKRLILPTISLSKLLGQTDLESDPDIYATVTTNPADPGYYIFKMLSTDGVNNVACRVNFTIYFDCIFKELGTVSSSLTSTNKKVLTPDSRNAKVSSETVSTVGVRDLPTMIERASSTSSLPNQPFGQIDRFYRRG